MTRMKLTYPQLELLQELSPKVFRVPSPGTNSNTAISLAGRGRGYIEIRAPVGEFTTYNRYRMRLTPDGVDFLKHIEQSRVRS